jgi:CBS domain containing-hemolysin-like protein
MYEWLAITGLFLVFLAFSALFSGVETGLYRLSGLRLRLAVESRRQPSILLQKTISDKEAFLVSDLIGNNLANYLATYVATCFMLARLESRYAAEMAAMLITAPALFVFAELTPKVIFFHRADTLLPAFSPFLYAFHKLMCYSGLVSFLKAVAGLVRRLAGFSAPLSGEAPLFAQSHVHEIYYYGKEEGLLGPIQAEMAERLAAVSSAYTARVMTPLEAVETVDVNSSRSVLTEKLRRCSFTRLPVWDGRPDNIIGFVNLYRALCTANDFSNFRNFVEPIKTVGALTSVTEAIRLMQNEGQKIMLVAKTTNGVRMPAGIVTMKDLVEELLGELAEW